MLDDDGVPREHGRHDDVDGREERVVPRGKVDDDAERFLHDAPLEAFLRNDDVGERALRDAGHVASAQGHPRDLVLPLSDGLAHHARDVEGNLAPALLHRGGRVLDDDEALAEGHLAKGGECGSGPIEREGNAGVIRELDGARGLERVGIVDYELVHVAVV